MSLFVKLCGIRKDRDLEAAVDAGADAVGFVLTPSPRQITPEEAGRLIQMLPDGVLGVAVFHDPSSELLAHTAAVTRPHLFQAETPALSDVPPDRRLPVVVDGPHLERDLVAALDATTSGMVLIDSSARGGSGRSPSWRRIASLDTTPARIVLAGGLGPSNVAEAISTVRPFGVDVSSGIESSPGEKDPDLMRAFVAAVRGVESRGEVA